MEKFIFAVVVSIFTFTVFANTGTSYKEQETREIKALSQEEIKGYLKGKGLGYAKVAELNHFPGPRHVLDMTQELSLTDEQVRQTQEIFDTMQARAIALGKEFVKKEQELDRQFASNSIDTDSLKILLSDIGALRANIRYVHLNAHLAQKPLLTKHQIQMYDQLRGYGKSQHGGHNHSH